jgi:hypothetical protein
MGFYHFDQIAAWTPAEVAWVDARLKFKGRIERDDWIAQATALAPGRHLAEAPGPAIPSICRTRPGLARVCRPIRPPADGPSDATEVQGGDRWQGPNTATPVFGDHGGVDRSRQPVLLG